MRIKIDEPELLPDLVAILTASADTVVTPVSKYELEVALLGSRTQPYLYLELQRRLFPWRAAYPDACLEIAE
jgi:hypothetical protein